MAKMNFIFQSDVRKLFDCFSSIFGVRISFSSFEKSQHTDFTELLVGGYGPQVQYPGCEYCNMLREQLHMEHRCLKTDKTMIEKATEQRQLIVYQCYGGMSEAVMPVFLGEEKIGIIMVGQYRTDTQQPPPAILRLWKKKIGNQRLKRAFKQTPCYDREKGEAMLELFSLMIKNIVAQRMILKEESTIVESLISYMKEHPETVLTLSQAARLISRSQSTLSTIFKKATGKSFKKYQIELKIEKAREYFRETPNITVREVAFKLGYEDPFYFCRLYKKYTGVPPSKDIKHKFK